MRENSKITVAGESVLDIDLKAFCRWFVECHGRASVQPTVFTTCLCGYFHTFTKLADKLLARCKKMKLVSVKNGVLTVCRNGEEKKS